MAGSPKKVHIRRYKGMLGKEYVWHHIRGTHYYTIGQPLGNDYCRICGWGVVEQKQYVVDQGSFTICHRHLKHDKFEQKHGTPQEVMDKYFEDLDILNDPKKRSIT